MQDEGAAACMSAAWSRPRPRHQRDAPRSRASQSGWRRESWASGYQQLHRRPSTGPHLLSPCSKLCRPLARSRKQSRRHTGSGRLASAKRRMRVSEHVATVVVLVVALPAAGPLFPVSPAGRRCILLTFVPASRQAVHRIRRRHSEPRQEPRKSQEGHRKCTRPTSARPASAF